MSTNSDLDRIKAAIRRRGTPASPQVEPMVTEMRTPDPFPPQPPNPHLTFYQGYFFMVEWTFGVPYLELEGFHKFLRDHEQSIADGCAAVTRGEGRYLGTWWIFGVGPKTYRTLWQYKSEKAIAELKAGLKSSPNLGSAVKDLRGYWARDRGRTEHIYQPGALFHDLKQASGGDELVELMLTPKNP